MPPTGILLLIAPDPPARNLRPPNSVQWHRFRLRMRMALMARMILPAAGAGFGHEDTGAERPFLKLKAGRPAPRVRRFLSLASRIFGARFGFRHLSPLKRSEPRTGRSAGRAGYSVSCAPPRKQVSPLTRFGRTPFAKASRGARLGGPHAAGAAPRPHFQDHSRKALMWAGMRGRYEGWRGAGITFYKNFRPCQRGLRLSLANDG
jgi:hypothetical protein